jgi:predicted nucleotidyltransferase
MPVSQTNFEAIRESYKPIFAALERAFSHFGIDFYLIGAQSRDVWTNHLSLVKRTTRDIDFAVMINDRSQWNELVAYLIDRENFTLDPGQPYRFFLEGRMLDLIPFGGVEKNGEVLLENPPTIVSVYGCREVTEEAVVISGKYNVITLAGLCIMKLIAFNENPGHRSKDFEDFTLVMKNYGEIAGEELFSGLYGDLIQEDFDFPIAGARMLGRTMQIILNKNRSLKDRIIHILEEKLRQFSKQEIDQLYVVNDKSDPIILPLKLIVEVLRGIADIPL